MNPAIQFLHSLSQALSASTLYAGTHPARQRAVKASYDALRILQSHDDMPSFSFLDRDVIYGYEVLRDLRDWEWSTRLAALGIQRIEVVADVSIEDYEIFINEVHLRLTTPIAAATLAAAQRRREPLRAHRSQTDPGRRRFAMARSASKEWRKAGSRAAD